MTCEHTTTCCLECNECSECAREAPALRARVAELEAWVAAIRDAAHGGDVSKNVIIMTGRALAGESAGEHAVGLLRAYRARAVPRHSEGTGEG